MAHFKYKAIDRTGKPVEGGSDLASIQAVADWLASEGLVALSISPAGKKNPKERGHTNPKSKHGRTKGNVRDRILHFTRELGVMLSSGLPLDRSLSILEELSDPQTAEMVTHIRSEVRKGKGLAEAFEGRDEFSPFYINMIRAGEASGSLESSLTRMSDYLERAKALRQIVTSAMTYPLILLSVAILSLVFLLAYVVPSFADLFTDMGGQLPAPTRFVMSLGDFMADWWWLVIGLCVGAYRISVRLLKEESVRDVLDQQVLGWPLIGDLVRNLETSRFARTLGVLLQGGVPLVGSLGIASQTISNRALRAEVQTATNALKEGRSLSASLMEGGAFPSLSLHMMQVGEETGRLEEMLLKVAGIYEDEVESVVKRLLALLEPVLILLLGVMIAGIIVSILLGILGVNDLIG